MSILNISETDDSEIGMGHKSLEPLILTETNSQGVNVVHGSL